ncbi:hypothetical protein KGV55_02995 [Candidatus Gracilibacteria bacterium]|nr:hypothetical protein [Candidatus Gracilibacteria bacterium]
MKFLFALFALFASLTSSVFAIKKEDITGVINPEGSIKVGASDGGQKTVESLLSFIQEFLLYTVLPVVVVGSALWIAYELFTADGDEAKMKQAWTGVVYSIVAIIFILLSYAIISIISTLQL